MECYLITNKVNDKKYVGITSKDKESRFKKHVKDACSKKHNMAIHKAIRKYGADNFELSVLDTAETWEDLCDLEKHCIIQYNSKTPNGYNLTDGGSGTLGYKFTEEQIKKCSESHLGQVAWNRGVPASKETKQKMSKAKNGKPFPSLSEDARKKSIRACTGKKRTKEQRQKMSNANKLWRENNPEEDAKRKKKIAAALKTKEIRKKMSKSHLGQIPWNKGAGTPSEIRLKSAISKGSKPFYVFKDGIVVGEFINKSECSRELNLSTYLISRSLNGVVKTTDVFIFRYK